MDPKRTNFYLGRKYDPAKGTGTSDPVMYDPANLTTHAVVTGMTGSGKTGLCIGLLEEAALQGIPSLIVDPKGDLTNLVLHLPDLAPADFEPWIDQDMARRSGKSVAEVWPPRPPPTGPKVWPAPNWARTPRESAPGRAPAGPHRYDAAVPPAEELRETDDGLRADDLREIWSLANPDEKVEGFRSLPTSEAEEFFLSSWGVGDPGMLVDIPANFNNPLLGQPGGPIATTALFPADPSSTHHSYINDHTKFRNIHAGPFEHHIFHLHAHQWVFAPQSDSANYMDMQQIGPGSGFTMDIANGGSGNRHKTPGDAIYHCHLSS